MTAKDIENRLTEKYPFIFRNNRGGIKTKKGYITFGIPQPPHGRKERDDEFKGSDYLGFIEMDINGLINYMTDKNPKQFTIPIFASIEIKTLKDKIKPGQIKWLRFVHEHGGIAELWQETEDGILIKRGFEI